MKRNESAKGHPTHLKQCAQVELDDVFFNLWGEKSQNLLNHHLDLDMFGMKPFLS